MCKLEGVILRAAEGVNRFEESDVVRNRLNSSYGIVHHLIVRGGLERRIGTVWHEANIRNTVQHKSFPALLASLPN
jgi:hypothetical protein